MNTDHYTHKANRDDSRYGGSLGDTPLSACPYRVVSSAPQASRATRIETSALLESLRLRPSYDGQVTESVLAGQRQREAASLRNLESLTRDRSHLLDTAVREIDEHISEAKNWLDIARRPYSGRTAQDIFRFESTLHRLESDRRDAYLRFWKDIAELRKDLIESAFQYGASRERAALLGLGRGE